MALTEFQRTICRLIAHQRLESGESYVAGAAALNTLTGATRISRDIDLFHDTTAAVNSSWEADRDPRTGGKVGALFRDGDRRALLRRASAGRRRVVARLARDVK